jgi:hypothetical protein
MAGARVSILALAVLWAAAAPARATEDPVKAWTLRLGTPARAAGVQEALEATASGEGDAVALARALAASRGVEAVNGLVALLRRRDEDVRLQALRGVAQIGLRLDRLAEALQAIVTDHDRSKQERWSAVGALGKVGDGRDMDTLLALTADRNEGRELRSAAFRAMSTITGMHIPYVHARWSYWWRQKRELGARRVQKAIAALQEDPGDAAAFSHEATLAVFGWVDVEDLVPALRAWLHGAKTRLSVPACRLVEELRLADLAPDVAQASRDLLHEELRTAAQATLRRLGVAEGGEAR